MGVLRYHEKVVTHGVESMIAIDKGEIERRPHLRARRIQSRIRHGEIFSSPIGHRDYTVAVVRILKGRCSWQDSTYSICAADRPPST